VEKESVFAEAWIGDVELWRNGGSVFFFRGGEREITCCSVHSSI